jgi:hypothetical protein
MIVHFLEAGTPLTKSYSRDGQGEVTKTPYPFVWEFTSHDEDIKTLDDLEKALVHHAAKGHCMLKGALARPLVKESRAGSTRTQDATQLVVLDLDGLPNRQEELSLAVDRFLDAIGLAGISYIVQWSASYGIENTDLRAHVFMLLDKPYSAPVLKQWLMHLNHTTPILRDAMSLTKTGNMISWPLDVSACQNDKLIYIAPPRLKGIKDPIPKGKRIQLVRRKRETITLAVATISPDKNRNLTARRINELREAAGLESRRTIYKMSGSVEVLVKPDACTITDMKADRGFVYFNFNGGDSWAYYHPENNPDYIFNFKGEPAYLTKELLPEYWAQLCGAPKVSATGDLYLAFCDRSTGVYWRGTYNEGKDALTLHAAKNETQVRHFAIQNGMMLGDFIPEWDLTFNPHSDVRVDPAARVINIFQPTAYMLAPRRKATAVPKTILKVITHVLGGDPVLVAHFLNWVAFIVQFRDRTRTAWVLHGTQGTGKGVLMNNILRPLLGETQTAVRRMEELNEPYNHWMKGALMVFIDEVQTKALQNERGAMAKLKNFITESTISIRAMYAGATESRNFTNWIFASNMADPVAIDKHDRRFNVGKYQPEKLAITPKEIDTIERELQSFYDYLMTVAVDIDAAHAVLDTEDRNTMIAISESSIDSVASAILEGRFEFLVDQLPTDDTYKANAQAFNKVEDYRKVLADAIAHSDRNTGHCTFSRDELRVIFEYCVGGMPNTPNKFTSLLKHHRIHISKVRHRGVPVNGLKTSWQDIDRWDTYQQQVSPAAPKVATKRIARVK